LLTHTYVCVYKCIYKPAYTCAHVYILAVGASKVLGRCLVLSSPVSLYGFNSDVSVLLEADIRSHR